MKNDKTLSCEEHILHGGKSCEMGDRKKGFNDLKMGKEGENIKKDVDVEQKELIEAYDKAKLGNEKDKEAYQTLLVNEVLKLCKKNASWFARGELNDSEDFVQEAFEAAWKKIQSKEFNPHQSMLSSFLTTDVKGRLRKAKQDKIPISAHYQNTLRKLNEAAQKEGYENCYAPELDVPLLSLLSGIEAKTVKNALEQGRIFVDSLSEIEEEGQIPSTFKDSPEFMAIKNEETKTLALALMTLNKYEQWLVQNLIMEPKMAEPDKFDRNGNRIRTVKKPRCMTVNEAAKVLQEPELLKHLELKKAPSNSTISQDLELIKQKLKHAPGMRETFSHYSYKKPAPIQNVEFEQADISDIQSAIDDDIEFLDI